jgi:hypothetical protein
MAYDDKSIDPTSLTQSGFRRPARLLRRQVRDDCRGNYVAQQILEEAPKSFQWEVLPPLQGTRQHQAANPQTLSVPARGQARRAVGEVHRLTS